MLIKLLTPDMGTRRDLKKCYQKVAQIKDSSTIGKQLKTPLTSFKRTFEKTALHLKITPILLHIYNKSNSNI